MGDAKGLALIMWNRWEETESVAPIGYKEIEYTIWNVCIDNIKGINVEITISAKKRRSLRLEAKFTKNILFYKEHDVDEDECDPDEIWNYDRILGNTTNGEIQFGNSCDFGNQTITPAEEGWEEEWHEDRTDKDKFIPIIEKYLNVLKEHLNSLKFNAYRNQFLPPKEIKKQEETLILNSFLFENRKKFECCVCNEEIQLTHMCCEHPVCKKCAIHLYFEDKSIKCPLCRQDKLILGGFNLKY